MTADHEKHSEGSTSKEIAFNYDEQVKSDQFIALQGQISQCLDERRSLIESRNLYIKLAIASWAVTLFVVFIYPGIQESKREKLELRQQALQAAGEAKVKPLRECKPCSQTTPIRSPALSSASDYIEHLDQKLGRKPVGNLPTMEPVVTIDTLPVISEPEEIETVPVLVEQVVKQTVFEWSIAWELQNTDQYLSYYGKRFIPENGMTLYKWKNIRRERIEKPASIRVRIDDLIVTEFKNGQATVEFIQHYMTPGYQDITHKRMMLKKEDAQWRIVREIVLG